jgi:acyl-coenzyme A thioesterase PaaI-like protein
VAQGGGRGAGAELLMTEAAFQDLLRDNFCFGCGADNPDGLQIKSHWQGDEAVCHYRPLPHHAAGPRHILNGGIIATLLDCHAICTAVADAYRREGRAIGSSPDLWYATGSLAVRYLRPAPLAEPVTLWAEVREADDRRTLVGCRLESAGKLRAEADVTAVRVPPSWRHGGERAPA